MMCRGSEADRNTAAEGLNIYQEYNYKLDQTQNKGERTQGD